MEQHVELFFKEGASDKVYKANLIAEGTGFIVNFAYGRRGAALTVGQKTPEPVSLEKAQKIYNKLIQEKTAKGYVEDPQGKAFAGTITESRDTGVRPQLLNEIEEEDLEKYFNDPDWCAQEKFDGRRRLLIIKDGVVTATNRKGLSVPVDPVLAKEISTVFHDAIIDGEDMGDYTVIFDHLMPNTPYKSRYTHLSGINSFEQPKTVVLAKTAWSAMEKEALYNRLKFDNAEGIVFKNINAEYKPGRPNSGGDQLKFKFCATATCMVDRASSTKRSVSLKVFDDEGAEVGVGNVTVYPNQDMPKPGDIVEVKYLYYFPGGSLFQPVLLNLRDDMNETDCTLKQLKSKRDET